MASRMDISIQSPMPVSATPASAPIVAAAATVPEKYWAISPPYLSGYLLGSPSLCIAPVIAKRVSSV